MKCITIENFYVMCERVKQMQDDDQSVGSSNFDRLMDYLIKENCNWIKEVNSKLEEA